MMGVYAEMSNVIKFGGDKKPMRKSCYGANKSRPRS